MLQHIFKLKIVDEIIVKCCIPLNSPELRLRDGGSKRRMDAMTKIFTDHHFYRQILLFRLPC